MEIIIWISLMFGLLFFYNNIKRNKVSKFNSYIIILLSISLFSLLRIGILNEALFFNPNYILQRLGLSEYISLEFYRDYEYWYLQWIEQFRLINPLDIYIFLEGYQFPPFFLYCLSRYEYGIFILCNIFNVFIFGGILKNLGIEDNRLLRLFSLNPVMILFGYMNWFNTSVLLLPILLSFYYISLSTPKFQYSMLNLCLAILIKQFTIILVPFYLMYIYFYKYSKFRLWNYIIVHLKYGIISFLIIVFLLFPYFLHNPQAFLDKVLIGGVNFTEEYISSTDISKPVGIVSLLSSLGFPREIIYIVAKIVLSWIPFILVYLLIYYRMFRCLNRFECLDFSHMILKHSFIIELVFCIIGILSLNIVLYPRGSFKYYLIVLLPFLVIGVYLTEPSDCYNGKLWIVLLVISIINRQFWIIYLIIVLFVYYKFYLEINFSEELKNE